MKGLGPLPSLLPRHRARSAHPPSRVRRVPEEGLDSLNGTEVVVVGTDLGSPASLEHTLLNPGTSGVGRLPRQTESGHQPPGPLVAPCASRTRRPIRVRYSVQPSRKVKEELRAFRRGLRNVVHMGNTARVPQAGDHRCLGAIAVEVHLPDCRVRIRGLGRGESHHAIPVEHLGIISRRRECVQCRTNRIGACGVPVVYLSHGLSPRRGAFLPVQRRAIHEQRKWSLCGALSSEPLECVGHHVFRNMAEGGEPRPHPANLRGDLLLGQLL